MVLVTGSTRSLARKKATWLPNSRRHVDGDGSPVAPANAAPAWHEKFLQPRRHLHERGFFSLENWRAPFLR